MPVAVAAAVTARLLALDPARVEADQKRLDARMLELRRWLQWAHPRLFVPSLPDPIPQCWPPSRNFLK